MNINIKKFVGVLFGIAFSLSLLNIGFQLINYHTGHNYIYGLVPMFYLGEESNIPTYFSSLLLLMSSILLINIGMSGTTDKKLKLKWILLSMIFFYLSVDETACLHEFSAQVIRAHVSLTGIFFYHWVVLAIPALILFGLFFRRFILSLDSKTRYLFIVAGAIYIGGALGLELIEGKLAYLSQNTNFIFKILVIIEETMEMFGVITFIYALLDYSKTHRINLHLSAE